MKCSALALLTTLVLATPVVSLATSYTLSATFSGTAADVNGSSRTYDFGGTVSALFDDAAVTGSSLDIFTVAPQSASFTHPTIGSTTFDSTNTGITLFYSYGVLLSLSIGGNPNGPDGVAGGTDDFALYLNPMGPSGILVYATTSFPGDLGFDFAPTVEFSFVPTPTVPEGTASIGYLAGAFGILVYALRRSKGRETIS